jgi:nucleoid-associated protein YgaU
MAFRRYNRAPIIKGGLQYGTSRATSAIYKAVERGQITFDTYIMQEGERLDTIAGMRYNDSRLWWIIAAASGIGWAPQTPPGTRLRIPRLLEEVAEVVG